MLQQQNTSSKSLKLRHISTMQIGYANVIHGVYKICLKRKIFTDTYWYTLILVPLMCKLNYKNSKTQCPVFLNLIQPWVNRLKAGKMGHLPPPGLQI